MKILELEIQNVRGIRSLLLFPKGKNVVIWGPNGSGKSTVVDALDFLLTGKIQRLMGSGTGGITLKQHGPHIQATPQTASVRAIVAVPNAPRPIELRRTIASPNELICDPNLLKYVLPVVELASRGQHILTRRESLKYVTAEAGKRAEEIQALLGVSDIELMRKCFVSVRTSARGQLAGAKRNLEEAQGQVNATLGIRVFSVSNVLASVNALRQTLRADSITILSIDSLKLGIAALPRIAQQISDKSSAVEQDLGNVGQIFSDAHRQELAQHESKLGSVPVNGESQN